VSLQKKKKKKKKKRKGCIKKNVSNSRSKASPKATMVRTCCPMPRHAHRPSHPPLALGHAPPLPAPSPSSRPAAPPAGCPSPARAPNADYCTPHTAPPAPRRREAPAPAPEHAAPQSRAAWVSGRARARRKPLSSAHAIDHLPPVCC